MVTLMHNTPLPICSHAVRTCWQSFGRSDDGGPKDRVLIDKVGNKFKHSSTLEHLVYTFYIQGISRALLQELARHRIASLSVKSTRYTLKELKDAKPMDPYNNEDVGEYCVLTGNSEVDLAVGIALQNLQRLIRTGVPNDIAKFAVPDAYKTELTWTINARSLQNFLSLRTAPSAMWEIRLLAYDIFDALPEDHKYLYAECVHNQDEAASA
ncbi:MAG: FAD-dependent thymidylate synthase [Candidatus Sedimenticola sp. (ex Thyasira tokunagai)]